MKILPLILTLIYITSCNLKTQRPSFADNISLSDTICLQEIEKAKQDIKENKLIYCHLWGFGGSSLRYENELDSLLSLYNIEYGDDIFSCISDKMEDNCYYRYMNEEVKYRYGENFVDSLKYIADSIYIFNHYNNFMSEVYTYETWDMYPIYPNDTQYTSNNHSGLQARFDSIIIYPNDYKYKENVVEDMASIKINIVVDEVGNAKVTDYEFSFWNKNSKSYSNKSAESLFPKVFIPLIEKTKWTPAKVNSYYVKGILSINLYLK